MAAHLRRPGVSNSSSMVASLLPYLLLILVLPRSAIVDARPTILDALLAAPRPAKDCWDGSDEDYNLCHDISSWVEPPEPCHEEQGEYICPSGNGCVAESAVCDGKPDCADGSDESFEYCRDVDCELLGKTFCPTLTGCMPLRGECNGVTDCADGSDEGRICGPGTPIDEEPVAPQDPGNQTETNYCADQGWQWCPSDPLACLLPEDFCDGFPTCKDGYDEANCQNHTCMFDPSFHCPKTFYCAQVAAKKAAVEARRKKREAIAAAIAEKQQKREEKAAAIAEKKRLQAAKAAAIAEKKRKQEEKAAAIAEKRRKQEERLLRSQLRRRSRRRRQLQSRLRRRSRLRRQLP
ncbi:hypothetical protein CLOM_g5438 [Closterium sp. NIES-68]|nr:hypothetical protein CLOM_g5438 [Closterium sp. NIES-68]